MFNAVFHTPRYCVMLGLALASKAYTQNGISLTPWISILSSIFKLKVPEFQLKPLTLTSQMSKLTYTLFLLLLLLAHADSQSQLHDQEQAILLKLKQHWLSPPSISLWTPSNTSHCAWPGINCTENSVTAISLVEKNITTTIPTFICDLRNLTTISLSLNYIPGEFPRALYNCSKLEHLDLSQNNFVGSIPEDIDRLARLRFLSLGANNFSGDIPPAIGRLQELRILMLYQNLFDGTFPSEIGNLSNLEKLGLAFNGFKPSILPSSFTQLKKLKTLWMRESNLIGEIPETIGNMEALELLDLSTNGLIGKLPTSLFMLKNLRVLYIFKNKLSGEIPKVIGSLNLSEIDLSANNLTGTIPNDIGKLVNLSGLGLFFNQLSGEIPNSIGRLPQLKVLKLFTNNLSGTLPQDFGRYSMLEEFQVSTNRLTGRLPEHLCAGGKLLGVIAFENNLSGELPESLGNCSSLKFFDVYNNSFSGNIPSNLWTLSNLTRVQMSDNLFSGELPDRLSLSLSRLEISNNNFSGKIPLGVSSCRNLVVFLASNNHFTGIIPKELTALPSLTTLLLDRNQLSGNLPSEIISWKSLNALSLSRNELSGQIPEEIGFLPVLTDLDLSENQFSGQIPPQIGHLRLTSFNLSSNNLTGRIPRELENAAYSSSFLNNLDLCSTNPFPSLNICNSQPRRKSSKISSRFLASITSIAAAVFVLALLFSFFVIRVNKKRKHSTRKHGSDSTWKLTSFQTLNFTKSNILSGLTENNMIGRGSSGKVYRVAVNGAGHIVAVKRICNNRQLDQNLEKEFLAEVKILSSIRHSNIVKLLCCLSSESSKLLVYEYMENSSLDRWLRRKNRASLITGSVSVHPVILDWPKRLQIAIGAAQGLCYMHHDCSPPIVHRDVKPSNILLDSEFNAKIADFGLARMLIKQEQPATMSAVAGSFGYIAPEYGHTTRVSEKIDVYSFGVILLELATGREANEGDENTCLAEWAWHHIQVGKPIVEALDEEIKEPSYLDEMRSVFKLGIICTGTMPSTRPSMKEVLQVLLRCSRPLEFGERNARSEYDGAPLLKNSRRERMSESDDGSLVSVV